MPHPTKNFLVQISKIMFFWDTLTHIPHWLRRTYFHKCISVKKPLWFSQSRYFGAIEPTVYLMSSAAIMIVNHLTVIVLELECIYFSKPSIDCFVLLWETSTFRQKRSGNEQRSNSHLARFPETGGFITRATLQFNRIKFVTSAACFGHAPVLATAGHVILTVVCICDVALLLTIFRDPQSRQTFQQLHGCVFFTGSLTSILFIKKNV